MIDISPEEMKNWIRVEQGLKNLIVISPEEMKNCIRVEHGLKST
jgi:hypothetical protein